MKLFVHSEVKKKNGCEKQSSKIEDVVLALGNEIARNILFIHAWTGCDTKYTLFQLYNLVYSSRFCTNHFL